MKRRFSITLCACLGALVFFSVGVFTGRHWLSEPAEAPAAVAQRTRASTRLLPSPPVKNKLFLERGRADESETELSPEERLEQTEKRVAMLATQLESLRDLTDDKLIIAVRALDLPNSSITALYSQYVEETNALEQADQAGFGPRHPKIVALNASLDIKYAQLLEASESAKRDLEGQLTATQRMLTADRAVLEGENSGDIHRQAKSHRAGRDFESLIPRLTSQVEHALQITFDAPVQRRPAANGKVNTEPAN
jgi:hypothetical protein